MTGTTAFDVHLSTATGTVRMGGVTSETRRGRTARVEFRYRADYLATRPGPALDADHPLVGGGVVRDDLPRGVHDAGPDGWGRRLLLRANRGQSLTEADFVLAVDDASRLGALRFTAPGDSAYLATAAAIPPGVRLDDLAEASRAVEEDPDDLAAVRLLLDAGSANLGGIRPKASLSDGDRLMIAKFPSTTDPIDAMGWEKLCLDVAVAAGIRVPANRLVPVGRGRTLLLDRFDRDARGQRIPYLSALSMTDAPDPASGDYLDLVDDLREADVEDFGRLVRELWRRLALNIALRNTDDHLRNHGFLWSPTGWSLSPAFDITPNPIVGAERTTALDGETSPVREARALMALAKPFGIPAPERDRILGEVLAASGKWREHAARLGLPTADIAGFEGVLPAAQGRLADQLDHP